MKKLRTVINLQLLSLLGLLLPVHTNAISYTQQKRGQDIKRGAHDQIHFINLNTLNNDVQWLEFRKFYNNHHHHHNQLHIYKNMKRSMGEKNKYHFCTLN